jgi:threonylcarbamoyladenosine tRNA methylthiotransferase MtaB
VNRVESDDLAARLLECGAAQVDESDATLIIVNTCTVTGEADAKARKAVRQALGAAREPVVVVTGCLAALDMGSLSALSPRVIVEPDKTRLERVALEALGIGGGAGVARAAVRAGIGFRTRAAVKIQDGCDNFCAYCIVPHARGVPRATPLDEIVSDVTALSGAGVREVVLTGINIGRYSHEGSDLGDVVRRLDELGVERIRLSSIEPPDLTPRLLGILADTPSVCEHLHVPLQSGDDRVLSAMGRRYTTLDYERVIGAAREALPGLAVTTDVIAGFPTETAEEHANTVSFIERIGFDRLHVFRYSVRSGTPAAEMVQVEPSVRSSRAAELREVGDRAQALHVARRAGTQAEVLIEKVDRGTRTGTTRDYLSVRVPSCSASPGDLVSVMLVEREGRLEGDPVS